MNRVLFALMSLAIAPGGVGCAPSLLDEFPFDGATPHGARITHEDLGGGVTRTIVDASAKEAWVYFDLDTGEELSVDEAFETNAWDLQFQRFKVYSNSGVHGSGGVGVAVIPDRSLEEVTSAPDESAFLEDADDPSSENDSPFLAGDGWYAYDLLKHKLTARNTVYVVRTTEGALHTLQFKGYYDAAGTAGVITLDHARLDAL
ncbi:MAG: HmuY family protein [Myxococcaceae bacterium]|nr:HmuY family protein [Myxococcaceae bacterium]